MILCVTPNVAVDRTYLLPHVQLGTVLRSNRTVVTAGGKGLNVARAATVLGADALAMGILGGRSGELIAELTAQEGLHTQWTWVDGETRNCAILLSEDGTPTTVVNDRGAPVSMREWLQFVQDITDVITDGVTSDSHTGAVAAMPATVSVVCICGTLPPGTPSHAPADLIEALLATGTPVWLDMSGTALARGLEARPTGIKINNDEAGNLLGRQLLYLDDVYDGAAALRREGVETVVITLGNRGAVLSCPAGEYHLRAPVVQAINSLGSGDAFLGALLVAQAQGRDAQTALAWAIAAGAANTLSPGGGRFARADFDDLLAQLL